MKMLIHPGNAIVPHSSMTITPHPMPHIMPHITPHPTPHPVSHPYPHYTPHPVVVPHITHTSTTSSTETSGSGVTDRDAGIVLFGVLLAFVGLLFIYCIVKGIKIK